MGSPRCLLMLLLLILIQDNKRLLTFGILRKPGRCLRIRAPCSFRETRQCSRDRHCHSSEKCCKFSCGWKCLNPKRDPCEERVKWIPCSDSFMRFYYSINDGQCHIFQDSSCSTYKNSFQSSHVCEKTCAAYGHRISDFDDD